MRPMMRKERGNRLQGRKQALVAPLPDRPAIMEILRWGTSVRACLSHYEKDVKKILEIMKITPILWEDDNEFFC